jgi:hypothetical protein
MGGCLRRGGAYGFVAGRLRRVSWLIWFPHFGDDSSLLARPER